MNALDKLIESKINLGHKNPHDFYDLLVQELGDDLVDVVKPYLADFITEMARHRIGALRRASVAKITARALESQEEVMLRALWVPANGTIVYKRIADMTADEFDARAAYLERMIQGIAMHARWCRDVATAIREQGVGTAGGLKELPPLVED